MNDILERLCAAAPDAMQTMSGSDLLYAAANEIGRLRAENERLRGCLESIRDCKVPSKNPQPDDEDWRWIALEAKRVAGIALASAPPPATKDQGL